LVEEIVEIMEIAILVAYDEGRVIGYKNSIPWRLPEDLKLFKKRTLGHCLIMGRKTWFSLPKRPLPERVNIVLTRDPKSLEGEDCLCATSIEEAVQSAKAHCKTGKTFVIGGDSVYESFINAGLVDKVIASEVFGKHQGDTSFPSLTGWEGRLLDTYEGFRVVEYTVGKSNIF
jgi:dihydrofolate reductase